MSRVAKSPIELPSGVDIQQQGNLVTVKGPKGQLEYHLHDAIKVEREGKVLHVKLVGEISATSGSKNLLKGSMIALSGTTRAIIKNHVMGVSKGYERKLLMVGVGYRAAMQGTKLNITAGFSHPVQYDVPKGISIETPSQTEIIIKGADKQLVGQVAANIRAIRSPEPYKGKGIRYSDEKIILKETKKK
ncbi:MAG: 50S ribosomal protein L6 [Gammaproteobacteria bacterium RIFCSPHIGHO2_12_FULL_35_23]|nr:MAG: 50S ribosomal protein L6 [Gammaproteobacteria bacterium RIFCSPHIGHO2_12_FULL_35_23]